MKAKFYALTVYVLLCLVGPVWTVLAGALLGIIRDLHTVTFSSPSSFTCSEPMAQRLEASACYCLTMFPQFVAAHESGDLPFTFVQRAPNSGNRPQFFPLATVEGAEAHNDPAQQSS